MGVNSRTLSAKRAPLLGKGVQRMSLNRETMAGGTLENTSERTEQEKELNSEQ
jgi:hypothetical protein